MAFLTILSRFARWCDLGLWLAMCRVPAESRRSADVRLLFDSELAGESNRFSFWDADLEHAVADLRADLRSVVGSGEQYGSAEFAGVPLEPEGDAACMEAVVAGR